MNKKFLLPLLAVLGGVGAFALRLWHNRTGFEPATGLPIPGAPAGAVLAGFLAVLTVLLGLLALRQPRETEAGPLLPRDFAAAEPRLLLLPVAGLLLMGLSGLADLYQGLGLGDPAAQLLAAADPEAAAALAGTPGFSPGAQKLLGALSLLSAASLFPAVTACRRAAGGDAAPFREAPLLLVPPVALVVRLVLTYRLDSVNPVLGSYYVELLALVLLTLGFYRLSSFAFQAGRTRIFSFYACGAAALSLAALGEGGSQLSTLLLLPGGAAVLLGFLLLMGPAPAAEPAQPEEPAPPEDVS